MCLCEFRIYCESKKFPQFKESAFSSFSSSSSSFFILIYFWLSGNSLDILFLCGANCPQMASTYYLRLLCALIWFWIDRNDFNHKANEDFESGFFIGFYPVSTIWKLLFHFCCFVHVPYSICVEDCGGDPLLSSAIVTDSLSLFVWGFFIFFSLFPSLCDFIYDVDLIFSLVFIFRDHFFATIFCSTLFFVCVCVC